MRRTLISASLCLGVLGAAAPAFGAGDYIVVLQSGVDPNVAAAKYGVTPRHVYTAALNGYAAYLTTSQLKKITSDPATDYVDPDEWIYSIDSKTTAGCAIPRQPGQNVASTDVARIGALQSPTAK